MGTAENPYSRRLIAALGACCLLAPGQLSAQSSRSLFLEDLTTAELRQRLETGCPVGLVINGGVEENGPHLALGKHNWRARAYGEAIARQTNGIVAPILPIAPNPSTMERFAGTLSLTPDTFGRVNEEVARSLIRGGFRRVALLGDHGAGQDVLRAVAARLDTEFQSQGVRVFFLSDFYARARTEIQAHISAAGHVPSGHGGLWDTAETMAVRPQAVRRGQIRAGNVTDGGDGPIDAEGMSGDPRPATAAMGRRFGAIRVRLAVAELSRLQGAAVPCR